MDDHGHLDEAHGLVSWWELWPMLGWGGYTVYLYATGQIFYLLRPIYGHIAFGGGLLLLAAFVYGWLLRRRGLSLVLTGALLALGCACLLLLDPARLALASLCPFASTSTYSATYTPTTSPRFLASTRATNASGS